MTNTTLRTPLHETRRRLTPRSQGKEKDVMLKSARRPQSQRRCALHSRKKPVFQKQAPVHKIESRRILARGWYTKFCQKGDGVECVVAYFDKESSYGSEDQHDGSDEAADDMDASDDDRDVGDDNTAWKSHCDRDWVPKTHKKDQMHDDLDSAVSCKRAQGDDDNRDHDHVISYLNSVDENIFHMDEDYPRTESVGYVRRRKRSVNSLHGGCNKGGLPRDGSKCSRSMSHLARQCSLWSEEAVFPSWKNKKPRVICKKLDKGGKAFNVRRSPTYLPEAINMLQRQEEPPPPTRPNSSAVSSNEGELRFKNSETVCQL